MIVCCYWVSEPTSHCHCGPNCLSLSQNRVVATTSRVHLSRFQLPVCPQDLFKLSNVIILIGTDQVCHSQDLWVVPIGLGLQRDSNTGVACPIYITAKL